MSRWVRVPICQQCWQAHHPGRIPTRDVGVDMGPCGLCRRWQGSGIRVRLPLDGQDRPTWDEAPAEPAHPRAGGERRGVAS